MNTAVIETGVRTHRAQVEGVEGTEGTEGAEDAALQREPSVRVTIHHMGMERSANITAVNRGHKNCLVP